MTASEQQAEYAARALARSVTDSVSPEQRAAIEADVLRRAADRFQREWPRTPERVTLTDEEVEELQGETGNSGHYVRGILAPAVERILAAREQALREGLTALADSLLMEADLAIRGETR